MHPLLDRQIKKTLKPGETLPDHCLRLAGLVSRTYQGFDEDRGLIERSLELSSRELQEINEQLRRDNERANQEKQKAETALESIGDGAFIVDQEGRLTFLNRVAETLAGVSIAEAVGKPYRDSLRFVFEKDRTENRVFIDKALTEGVISQLSNHTLLISRKGNEIPVAQSAAPIKDGRGAVGGCIVIFRDVSREREIERMKSDFISVTAHQLRTPLTAIRWSLESVFDLGSIQKEQRQLIEVTMNAAAKMSEVVNALLNIARIESRRLSVVPKETVLCRFAEEVFALMKPLADKKHQALVLETPDSPIAVQTDQTLLNEIFSNLLSNAIKYTPDGGQIRVRIVREGSAARVEVTDNGYGIPQAQQPRIFEKFFRANNTMKIETEGTGLGLNIARQLTETLGGTMGFSSVEGQGTTFWFTLPLKGSQEYKGEVGLAVTTHIS